MKTYTLQLTEQDIQIVAGALAELKLKESLNTFINIKNQMDAQTPSETETKEEVE